MSLAAQCETKFHPRIRKGRCLTAGVSQDEVHKKITDACDAVPAAPDQDPL